MQDYRPVYDALSDEPISVTEIVRLTDFPGGSRSVAGAINSLVFYGHAVQVSKRDNRLGAKYIRGPVPFPDEVEQSAKSAVVIDGMRVSLPPAPWEDAA